MKNLISGLALLLVLSSLGAAQKDWEEKWTTDKNNEHPLWKKAVEHRRRGEVDEAMVLYRQFLKEDPNEISVIVSMGSCYAEKGDLDQAEAWWRKALVVVPGQQWARIYLGRLLYHRGRFEEAETVLEVLANNARALPSPWASAHLNLGKIAMVRRKWRRADRHFKEILEDASAPKGKRNMARKGRRRVQHYRDTRLWVRERSEHLNFFFSPRIQGGTAAKRKVWVQKREKAWMRICGALGLSFPERLPVYVFKDGGDAYGYTGHDELTTWKYSWWEIATGWDRDPAYDLAHQLLPRVTESRAGSKVLYEGLCCVLAYPDGDQHSEARRLLREGRFPTLDPSIRDGRTVIAAIHANQRRSLDDVRPIARSFVADLVKRYGLKAVIKSYSNYNNVMLNPDWVDKATRKKRWGAALSEVLQRGVGVGLDALESAWIKSLGR